jgi:hypothetical protein
MTRRWLGAAAFVLVVVLTACNGDDDDAAVVESSAPETTVPETTSEPPDTTEATTTTTSTTVEPTTTTVDEEALKAQIAEDYLRAEQAFEDLIRNPPSEGLDERAAAVAVPGSALHGEIVASIEQRIATGERIVPGNPDYSDVFVEDVELTGDGAAEVTACVVTNQLRIDASGQPVGSTGGLFAARIRQPLQLTPQGWLKSSPQIRVDIQQGVASCAP